jgi:hypothetical protein
MKALREAGLRLLRLVLRPLDLGQRLGAGIQLDRLAQRFHPDPGGLAACLGLQVLKSCGDRVERGDAAVVAGVRLLQPLGQIADRPFALDHHPRQ